MKHLLVIMLGVFLLAGCEDMSDIKTATLDEMHEWMYGEPPKEPEPIVLDSRYCYRARSDVLCYSTPQPGKEEQFIGAQ